MTLTPQDLEAISHLFDHRFDAIDERFDAIDERFEAIDEKFDAIDEKFDAIDEKFERLYDEMDNRFEAIDERFDAMDEQLDNVKRSIRGIWMELENHVDPKMNEIFSVVVDIQSRTGALETKADKLQENVSVLTTSASIHAGDINRIKSVMS